MTSFQDDRYHTFPFPQEAAFINKQKEPMISTHDYVSDITDEQKAACEKVREACKLVEQVILERFTKDRGFHNRCYAEARTHLEAACMYAIKGIVFEGKEVIGY